MASKHCARADVRACARADAAGCARARRRAGAFTLVEVVIALLISGMLLLGLSGSVTNTLAVRDLAGERNRRIEDARFAMERMTRAIQAAEVLFVPRPEDPRTPQDESVHEPGALAVNLDHRLDRDRDGIFDADNDGDGLFDEDPSGDLQGDRANGVAGIDDDRDGSVDEAAADAGPPFEDDDEDGATNEDPWNGLDDDGDGQADEDTRRDRTGEGVAGLPGVDDDGDGSVDEGDANDDDEDGRVDEDWVDTVAFRLVGSDLLERIPVPEDVAPPAGVDGADFLERVVVADVANFRVARLPQPASLAPLVEVTLGVALADGEVFTLSTVVRLGSAL